MLCVFSCILIRSSLFDTPTSGSKTTPTSSARKKRRRKGSGVKTEPRQLFSPVIAEEGTTTTEQSNDTELEPVAETKSDGVDLDKMIGDLIADTSLKTIDTNTCIKGCGGEDVPVVVATDTSHNGDSRPNSVSGDDPVSVGEGKGGGSPRGLRPWGGRNDR